MTVTELIEKLQQYPQDAPVYVLGGEYQYESYETNLDVFMRTHSEGQGLDEAGNIIWKHFEGVHIDHD